MSFEVVDGAWRESYPSERPPMTIRRCVRHRVGEGCEARRPECVVESIGYEPPVCVFVEAGEEPSIQPLVVRSIQRRAR